MNYLIEEEINEYLHERIQYERDRGSVFYEKEEKTYLTSSLKFDYETDSYYASYIKEENLKPIDVLKICAQEISNLKSNLRRI